MRKTQRQEAPTAFVYFAITKAVIRATLCGSTNFLFILILKVLSREEE